jgi:hypothetical protein
MLGHWDADMNKVEMVPDLCKENIKVGLIWIEVVKENSL